MPLAFILQLTLPLETGFRVNGGKTSHVQHFNSEKIDDKKKSENRITICHLLAVDNQTISAYGK